jgi:hypothetical protein
MTSERNNEDEADFERDQEDEAAAEAGAIGGRVSSDGLTEAELEAGEAYRAVNEGGGGESEGFELAEAELEEHASHGDEHSAGRVLEDAALLDEGETERGDEGGEADEESGPDE